MKLYDQNIAENRKRSIEKCINGLKKRSIEKCINGLRHSVRCRDDQCLKTSCSKYENSLRLRVLRLK